MWIPQKSLFAYLHKINGKSGKSRQNHQNRCLGAGVAQLWVLISTENRVIASIPREFKIKH